MLVLHSIYFVILFSQALCNEDIFDNSTTYAEFMTTGKSDQVVNTAQCVLKLSAKYFVEKRALSGSIVIININSYVSSTQRILLETIHSGIKYSIMVKDSFYPHKNASHFPEKAKNYMLILEEKTELTRNILQLNKLPTWNPHAKAVVFYELKFNESESRIVVDIINELRSHKLLKTIVFIYSAESDQVVAYTWKPYSDTNCGGECDAIYILDKCKDNILIQYHPQEEVFPLDMKGCPLVVYSVVSEPYVMPPITKLYNTSYDDAYAFDLGIEIKLLKIISQFTNMSLILRTSELPEDWGTIETDGTATGMYSVLRNDSADLIIGNMQVDRKIRQWFDPTNTYIQDEVTWCVPKAGLASTWANLVIIFQWSTWVATFAALVLMSLMFHLFYYKEKTSKVPIWPTNSCLQTLSMLLGWGALFKPRAVTFRILIFTWLVFSVNVNISYGSFLRSFLIHPRYDRQIDSESDLISAKIPLGGREAYRSYFETNNVSLYYIYRHYKSMLFSEAIQKTALDRNFAVVSSRRQAEFQDSTLGRGAKLIFCFSEGNMLYQYGVVLLSRKWFPLLNRFNLIIRSVSENGLIQKWNNELFIHSASGMETSDIVPLGMQHLLGAFLFIGFMFGGCIIIFIAEILFFQIKTFQNKRKHIVFLE